MKTLKLFSLLALISISLVSLNAQDDKKMPESAKVTKSERPDRSPEERAKMRSEHLKKELNLTDEQSKAMEKDNLEFSNKMKDVQKKHREEIQKMSKDRDARLKKILTEDQMVKMYENRGASKERMKMGRQKMMMQRKNMKERQHNRGEGMRGAPHRGHHGYPGGDVPKGNKLEKE